MAFERTSFDNSDTAGGVESRSAGRPSQQEISNGLAQAFKEGRRGIFLLGSESSGAGKSSILHAAVKSMGCFAVWIRPDDHALDTQLNPKRVVRQALNAVSNDSHKWYDQWANHFLGKVCAVGLRAGLIPSRDPEAWANAMEATPERYLCGRDGAGLMAWLAEEGRATIRYQIALRWLSTGETGFDEVDEALAWMNFFLSDRSVSSSEWLARWIDLGNVAFSGADVKFTRQTLALVNAVHPVVCLLDQIDGVMGRPRLAREVARTALDWMNCTSMVVIAVNRDVWEAGFLPALPDAWSDRLSACSDWLGDNELSEPEMFLKGHPSNSPNEPSRGEISSQPAQEDAPRVGSVVGDSQTDRAAEPITGNDFLVYAEEPTAETLVDARRGLFLDAGDRLPFVTVAPETDEDRRQQRMRWNTPEHVAWIGLAEPSDKIAWRAFFTSFAASSADAAAVKLVVPLFDDESESVIRACAANEGIDPSLDDISWLDVSRLTPAGWWRSRESHNHTIESFVAATPLWNAITEPVTAKH